MEHIFERLEILHHLDIQLSELVHFLKPKIPFSYDIFGLIFQECADLECMALSMSTMDGFNSEILGDEKFM